MNLLSRISAGQATCMRTASKWETEEDKHIFTLIYCIYHLQIHNKYDLNFFFPFMHFKNVSLLNFTVWADWD